MCLASPAVRQLPEGGQRHGTGGRPHDPHDAASTASTSSASSSSPNSAGCAARAARARSSAARRPASCLSPGLMRRKPSGSPVQLAAAASARSADVDARPSSADRTDDPSLADRKNTRAARAGVRTGKRARPRLAGPTAQHGKHGRRSRPARPDRVYQALPGQRPGEAGGGTSGSVSILEPPVRSTDESGWTCWPQSSREMRCAKSWRG